MFLTNLKLILRNLRKSKTTSSVNIIGFSVSLAACFVIGIYIQNEFSYDKFNKNYHNIYRVVNDDNKRSEVDYTIKDEVLKKIPEVVNSCHLLPKRNRTQLEFKGTIISINASILTDNDFFRIFSFPLIVGNQNKPFDNNNRSLLISEHVAGILFGSENPMGKYVRMNDRDDYTVCGVFKDFPENSSISAEIILNESYEINKRVERYSKDGKQEFQRTIFLQIGNPAQAGRVTEKINALLAEKDKLLKKVRLQPFSDMYLFDSTTNWNFNKGNYSLILLFAGIAVITLILASINFINLSVAQYNERKKETGIRKTFGARRIQLIRSFLSESLIVTLISVILAFLLTDTFLSFFNSLFGLHLQTSGLISIRNIFVFIILTFAIGIIIGIVPALIITSFNPVQIFQKRFLKSQGKNYMSNILTTFQFTASMALIISVILIIKQLYFIRHEDLGFNDNNLLKINVSNLTEFESLKSRFLQDPLILNATYSSGIPGEINYSMNPGDDATTYTGGVPIIHCDTAFISTFGIKILKGYNFPETGDEKVCLISETALKAFGWDKDWQDKYFQKENNTQGYRVVGVFKDFHFRSMYQKMTPLVLELNGNQKSFLTLRLSDSNLSETMAHIKKIWKELEPGVLLDYTFYDTWFDSMYKNEYRLAKMVSSFAILAIIISCLGVFGQAMLNTISRTREIGIRKINGARTGDVMAMLNADVMKWVFLSFIIASPISWYLINKWMENFAFRTGSGWWVFISGGFAVAFITYLTVSYQSWKASNINPVECLKDE